MCAVQDSFKHWTAARRRIDYPIRECPVWRKATGGSGSFPVIQAGSKFVTPDHQSFEHRIVLLDAVIGGGALHCDPHLRAEAFAQVGGVLGLVFRRGARRLHGGGAEVVHEMSRQALDDLPIPCRIDLRDFGEGAAPVAFHADERSEAMALGLAVARTGGIAHGVSARNQPLSVPGGSALGIDEAVGGVEPHSSQELHQPRWCSSITLRSGSRTKIPCAPGPKRTGPPLSWMPAASSRSFAAMMSGHKRAKCVIPGCFSGTSMSTFGSFAFGALRMRFSSSPDG